MKKLTFRLFSHTMLSLFLTVGLTAGFTSCGDEDEPEKTETNNNGGDTGGDSGSETPVRPDNPSTTVTPPDVPYVPVEAPEIAKGADVSWLSELEAGGYKFYNNNGTEKECMTLLRDDCGVNAIRLRVWVNPANGFNGREDVLNKARRAHELGMALMIDFHFSDTWADPAHQSVPAKWVGLTPEKMADSIKVHVWNTLAPMLREGFAPEWVQIGNETSQGMLFESGKMKDQNAGEFPRYLKAGYEAVKAISPDSRVIVHLPNGHDSSLYNWFFDLIEKNGAEYDMIGMSLYPESETWPVETDESMVDNCIANIKQVASKYNKDVMLCEIGFHHDRGEEACRVIKKIFDSSSSTGTPAFKGIFYWEPEAPEGYNGGYHKGCFINGRPNEALNAFIP